jgi:hypothetical protein
MAARELSSGGRRYDYGHAVALYDSEQILKMQVSLSIPVNFYTEGFCEIETHSGIAGICKT